MKMALSEFVLREKGIYGILHVIILILSLFLVISISVDTFKGIPFYEQSVYMKYAPCSWQILYWNGSWQRRRVTTWPHISFSCW